MASYEISDWRAKAVIEGNKLRARAALQQHTVSKLSQHVNLLSGGRPVGCRSNEAAVWHDRSEVEDFALNHGAVILELSPEIVLGDGVKFGEFLSVRTAGCFGYPASIRPV